MEKENLVKSSYGAMSPPVRKVYLEGPNKSLPLLDFLVERGPDPSHPSSRSWLKWLVKFGAVYVNHRRCLKPKEIVKAKDTVRVHMNPRRYEVKEKKLTQRILFENDNFAVVNKPTGLPMHATLDNVHENLIAGLGHKYLLTHRLDVPTSGLVVLSKSKQYQGVFNGLLTRRELLKKYQALVEKPVKVGMLEHYMRESKWAPKELSETHPDHSEDKWVKCLLEVEACTPVEDKYLLEIKLHTGRTHQIRAQLGFIGAPIWGDEMYGGTPSEFFGLHASRLEFKCPLDDKDYKFFQKAPFAPV